MSQVTHVASLIGRASAGIGAVVANLAVAQAKLNREVAIWSLDGPESIDKAKADYALQNVSLRSFQATGPIWLGWSWQMWRAVTADASQMQLLHQHGVWMAISACSNRFRTATGKPVVLAPHGSLEPYALAQSKRKKNLALLAYEKENLHKAACLHALSPKEADDFRSYGLHNPIAVVPNGISSAWLASQGQRAAAISHLHLPGDRRLLLFLSRIHPKKGLPMLLKAMASLRTYLAGWLLVIAGPDELNHQSEIVNIIQQLELQDYVRIIGPMFGQHKRDLFAAADLFVLPSYSEGAPMVVLEALGAGLPVLTTQATPWQELAHYRCGYWTPATEDAIGAALQEALSLPPHHLAQMGAIGRQLVAQEYTWESSASKLDLVYQWLLKGGSPPSFVKMN